MVKEEITIAASVNIPDALTGEPILFTLDILGTGVQADNHIAGVVDPSSISVSGGEKDGEGVAMGNGGRAWKQSPQGDYTLEFDAYTAGVHATSSNTMFGLQQFFDGQSLDTTEAIKTNNARTVNLVRAALMWTEDTTVTDAAAAVTVAKWAYRFSIANARFTKLEYSYSDSIWKISVALKCPAFKKDGTANRQEESGDGSAATNSMPALATYSTSANW